MFPPIFTWLKASQAVKDIVGTNPPRIYRSGNAPQTTDGRAMPSPYVTWFVVGAEPANNLSDPVPVDKYPIQVDCWHQTEQGVESLATEVRDALEPHGVMTGIVANLREPETRLFRIGITFDFWHGRPPSSS